VIELCTFRDQLTALFVIAHRVTPPVAPASLIGLDDWEQLLELHSLLDITPADATFATSDRRDLPITSELRLGLQSWWMPGMLELVTDLNKSWRELQFDDESMVDFCPLCYRDLEEPDPVWIADKRPICPNCHHKYIVADYLGVRQ
jgi:hypothetical protein